MSLGRRDQLARPFRTDPVNLQRALLSFGQLLGGAKTSLIEQFGIDVTDPRNSIERSPRRSGLFLGLGFAAHVKFPSGQAMGQTHVLAAFADRKRELIVGDDHLHGMLILVDDYLGHLGRGQRAAHQLGLIFGPGDDVDFFTAQFLDHRLHARSLHADTGADRIDVGIVGINRHFGAAAGFARALANFNDALVDFGDLLLEQFAQKIVGGARQYDRKALVREVHFGNQGADTVALAIALVGDLLLFRQDRLGASQVDDHIFALEALHDTRDDLVFAILELAVNLFAFGVADMLDQVLLGGLCGN